ncbi:phosphomannomutase/phosphoglucomutase [Komagataeibacter intermedius]|mgnify:CR=1 FL=1|uniref:Phosphomannomutase n=2 Tax=Komagataeibacter intermedius TaxID=66229 RepID=A0A0N1FN32_9PROT|nr:phosphomannomutase/phosphoglucomutase [Komagataeibacter intermedius]KPH88375.1 phosphomannomutase [Komagataeibacter intermedius AF2]MCF3635493.1 phosphomannomutase/phosphoglucomutase [Komagataeibacter intermedius]GAN86947.1 phosphomanno mutase [Komagataeibacter intermedius TF2]GBQ78665.1 phosphomannomutase [Komagataeibacter intermedius NRIC 0521]
MIFRHRFDPTSLREYDIRGTVGRTISPEDAYAIGRTFGNIVAGDGGSTVVIGYDGRLSSPSLEHALVEGAVASGMDVVRIGCGPTPMLYFASARLNADGAIMVTGSHNPPDHNGFKLVLANRPFFGPHIQMLGQMAATGDVGTHKPGTTRALDVKGAYIDRLLRDRGGDTRPLNVIWDCGNGAAGDVLSLLVRRLPGRHRVLNAAIDGHFPAHHPDPTIPANLRQLIAAVRQDGADLGIAFDGDADRLGVVDDTGEILWADQLLLILARDMLRDHPGATVIADIKTSQVVFDEIARSGGQPCMWKSGHSQMKTRMAETGALLAGEMSGHIFFADRWYGFDDALYAALRLLDVVSRLDGPLSTVRRALPHTVSTPELRFACPDTRKFDVIAEVAIRLEQAGATVCDIDGVRVSTPDGWWLLRASNTQASLVARAEGTTQAALDRLMATLSAQLTRSGVTLPDFSDQAAPH